MLLDCPECHGKVSSDADACPHCGYRVRGREHMVQCPSCNHSVIPITSPHDIRRHCPICNKAFPAHNGCAALVVAIPIIVVAIFIALLIGGCSLLTPLLHRVESKSVPSMEVPPPAPAIKVE